jgi:hypothetical protein
MASKLKAFWHTFVHAILGIEAVHTLWGWYTGGALLSAIGVLAGYIRENAALSHVSAGFFVAFILMLFLNWLVRRRTARRRDERSNYTDKGLSWKIIGHGLVQERAVAILRVTSTAELPQPMELAITCLGGVESIFGVDLYPNPVRPTQRDEAAEIEIDHHPPGQKMVFLTLRSPKLRAPAYLDVHLKSVGNAEIRVLSVKRSPEGWEGTFWKT